MRRLNLNVPDSVSERLQRLLKKMEAVSITEVIRRSLAIAEDELDRRAQAASPTPPDAHQAD